MEDILRIVLDILLTFLTVFIIYYVFLKRRKINKFKKFIISTIIFLISFGGVSFFMSSIQDSFYVVVIVYLFLLAIAAVADWIKLLIELRKR